MDHDANDFDNVLLRNNVTL